MAIASDLSQLIGNTPLVELARFAREYGLKARLLAKAECFNAAGSVKDRVARELIEDAERSGRLKPGGTVSSRQAATPASARARSARSGATGSF